jgi:Tfp pilus assembly PilM family ATPase
VTMLGNLVSKSLGSVYFSSKGLAIAEQSGGHIRNQGVVPYPERAPGTSMAITEDVFEVFKYDEVELVAFMQKAIRDCRLEAKNIIVALPPKDLIIRFFEMPNIPRSEIAAGINFEMKKYIPFKIEELAYDFQYRLKPRSNIIEVILCGMRQEPLNRYLNLFKQLELETVAFEPGLFSLFRLLVVRNKIPSKKSCVVLEFDREEANILVIDKGFPYFTRDIKLLSPQGGAQRTPEEFDAVLFRLINEVRVSLDYYRRQYMKKEVEEMLIITDKKLSNWVDQLSRELGISAHFVSTQDLLKVSEETVQQSPFDLTKAFGASLRSIRPGLVTLNLGKMAKEKARHGVSVSGLGEQSIDKQVRDFIIEFKAPLIRGAIVGCVLVVLGYGMGFSKVFPLEKELLVKTVKQPPLIAGVDLTTLESIETSEAQMLRRQSTFENLIDEAAAVPQPMIVLPRLLPAGVWLNRLRYDAASREMQLSCSAYDPESKRRAELMNDFIGNLKKDPAYSALFSAVELLSYRESGITFDESYLEFEVICKSKDGGRSR